MARNDTLVEMFGRSCRMRSLCKLQVAGILFVGVLIVGYQFLPRILSRSVSQEVLRSKAKSPVSFQHKGPVPAQHDKKVVARQRAIQFTPSGRKFIVEGKEKKILSGAIHYFRVVPAYWEDRLTKLQAAGLNTVETYMPWNLHEPTPGKFDFTGILDVVNFLTMAHSLGLHAIVRPGPYICSEWELGGLPAWLLHDPHMVVRTMYPGYLEAVRRYFTKVFELLTPLQSVYGGPIIAFQIENEFAHYFKDLQDGKKYMSFLYKLMRSLGVMELLFTSDGQTAVDTSLKLRPAQDVLLTVNFMTDRNGIKNLIRVQPDKPPMVMEFWSGWFDHWNEVHLSRDQLPRELGINVAALLDKGASINFYMFHGGTNFGFMNGANWGDSRASSYLPTITSYDYGAPLSENGDVTQKYQEIRKVIQEKEPNSMVFNPLPSIPNNIPTASYGDMKLTLYMSILETLNYLPEPHVSETPIPMEFLPLHGCGQSYGFVLYRTLIPSTAHTIKVHKLNDFGMAIVDSKPAHMLSFFDMQTFSIPKSKDNQNGQRVLDILVENAGRVNYGQPLESRKGILSDVEVDDNIQKKWKIYSLEFKPSFIESIESGGLWSRTPAPSHLAPSLFKGTFSISGKPADTFIDMEGWEKGVIFINGVNLGRYWKVGPQRTLYIPAPILKRGVNKVMIFEMYTPSNPQKITFRDNPVLNTN